MHIFMDESGSISWASPGVNPFACLIVPDRSLSLLTGRFSEWKRSVVGKSNAELKGSELSSENLESFTTEVLPNSEREPILSVVAADTSVTQEVFVAGARDQLADQYALLARRLLELDPPNKSFAQAYTEIAGWTRHRSSVNFLWISTAELAIAQAVQYSVLAFMEPEDDVEFENIEISVDRSFIKEKRPTLFWKEFIRLAHIDRSRKRIAFQIPNTWRARNHPFHRKYDGGGYRDFTDLFRNHLTFVDSRTSVGIQIADICAHICRRYYRGETDLRAYANLKRRIMTPIGATLNLRHFDETSLFTDGLENHANLRSTADVKEELKTLAKADLQND
jgi:hypothetical protein